MVQTEDKKPTVDESVGMAAAAETAAKLAKEPVPEAEQPHLILADGVGFRVIPVSKYDPVNGGVVIGQFPHENAAMTVAQDAVGLGRLIEPMVTKVEDMARAVRAISAQIVHLHIQQRSQNAG